MQDAEVAHGAQGLAVERDRLERRQRRETRAGTSHRGPCPRREPVVLAICLTVDFFRLLLR